MSRLGLISLWERHQVDYTHMHTDFKSTSVIDHFIMNERLLSLVVDCGPLHLGDNRSRHSPIMMKLDLGHLPVQKRVKATATRRPCWYKAEQHQVEEFTSLVHDKLSSLQVPESLGCSDPHCQVIHHTQERDSLVVDVMSCVIAAYQCLVEENAPNLIVQKTRPFLVGETWWSPTSMMLSSGMVFGRVQIGLGMVS